MNDLKITVDSVSLMKKLIGICAFVVANAFSMGLQTAPQGWWIVNVGIQKCLVHPLLTTLEYSDLMVPLELPGFAI